MQKVNPRLQVSRGPVSRAKQPRSANVKKASRRIYTAPSRSSKRGFSCSHSHHQQASESQSTINYVINWSDERKHRTDTYNELAEKYSSTSQSSKQQQYSGFIKLPKGQQMPLTVTQHADIPLQHIPQALLEQHRLASAHDAGLPIDHTIVAATVNGQLWDLQRPFDFSAIPALPDNSNFELEFHHADSPIGQQVLWHSTAHILGQALELEYQHHVPLLSDGPSLPEGFFYDIYIHDKNGQPINIEQQKMKKIQERMKKIISQNQQFERIFVTIDEAREVFRYNPFKLDVLSRIQQQQHDIAQAAAAAALDAAQQPVHCADTLGFVALYKCGSFIDLCRGPHILNTSQCGAVQLLKNSASVMKHALPYEYKPALENLTQKEGQDNTVVPDSIPSVQRVYGISFPTDEQLTQFIRQKERAEEYDHRKLGKLQHLFMFHSYSPGSPFWLPHGTRIYNKLVDYLRQEYRIRGYHEVRTPQVFDKTLWETSGHWQNYKEDMFFVSKGKETLEEQAAVAALLQSQHANDAKTTPHKKSHDDVVTQPDTAAIITAATADAIHSIDVAVSHETAQQALKPMNCPGHCLLYNAQNFSYRDLPIRYADFSNLHRNEASGALSGLTRVRCFAQDDAHIFCRQDQLQTELFNALTFIQDVYKTFNFPVQYKLSTRPESYIGSLDVWEHAENTLKETLTTMNVDWALNEGDGAFYGPKIDVTVKDALGRYHQCATMQLDFNLPERFGLSYKDHDAQQKRPVMIHRAILGSLERFIAVLLEHTEGNLPLWLSPRQVLVTTVSPECEEYCNYVAKTLQDKGVFADVAQVHERIAKQVKLAQSLRYNYIVTVGKKEIDSHTVTVRPRGWAKEEPEPMDVTSFATRILDEIASKKM